MPGIRPLDERRINLEYRVRLELTVGFRRPIKSRIASTYLHTGTLFGGAGGIAAFGHHGLLFNILHPDPQSSLVWLGPRIILGDRLTARSSESPTLGGQPHVWQL